MYHELNVYGFAMDSAAQLPVVILKDAEGERTLPVWIQPLDAVALAAVLVSRSSASRSDLLTKLLGQLGYVLDCITVDDLQENLYTVNARFTGANEPMTVSVGMAEALGLSLRLKMPLRVAEGVLEKAATVEGGRIVTADGDETARYAELLERLNPSDLGKYPM